jgi:hypothetical protein
MRQVSPGAVPEPKNRVRARTARCRRPSSVACRSRVLPAMLRWNPIARRPNPFLGRGAARMRERDQNFPVYFGNVFDGSCVKFGKLGIVPAGGRGKRGPVFSLMRSKRKRARQGPLKAPSFPCRAQALAALICSIRQIARRELPKHRPQSASVKLFVARNPRGETVTSSQSVQRMPLAWNYARW